MVVAESIAIPTAAQDLYIQLAMIGAWPLDESYPRSCDMASIGRTVSRNVRAEPTNRSSSRSFSTASHGRVSVGRIDDPMEAEADRVAKRVMAKDFAPVYDPRPTSGDLVVRRKCRQCEEEDEAKGKLQRKANGSLSSHCQGVPSEVDTAMIDAGAPLEAPDKVFFESRFGRDFSGVRVHAGDKADRAARSVGALAFTVGRDLVFAAGAYRPATTAGRSLIAHELVHVVQQGGAGKTGPGTNAGLIAQDRRMLRRQAVAPLEPMPEPELPDEAPDWEPAPPALRGEPANDNAPGPRDVQPRLGPRNAPSPYDDSFDAALARANIRSYAERQKLQAERPVATLERGGASPNFITEHGSRRVEWLGGPGGGGSVVARNRSYHVLDAIEDEIGKATTEDTLEEIVENHFPLVAAFQNLVEPGKFGTPGRQPRFRTIFHPISDEPVFLPDFDPGAAAQLQVFTEALEKRIQQVPALAKSRLRVRNKQRGGCRLDPILPMGNDPLSAIYCHAATGSPYSYRITIAAASGALTQRWAEIDALRGNTWFECKCGYEALLSGKARGEGVANAVLEKMDHQVLNHLDIARTCGLDYRFVVSNEKVAEILRSRWFGNVIVDVRPWDPCD